MEQRISKAQAVTENTGEHMACKYCGGDIGTGNGFICRTCKELRTNYGMITPDSDTLLEEQDWSCAVYAVFIQTEERRRTAMIDHCHSREE